MVNSISFNSILEAQRNFYLGQNEPPSLGVSCCCNELDSLRSCS
jgi:hypothetical protein